MPPKKKFKDEEKDEEKKAQEKEGYIAIIEAVLGKLISSPESWNDVALDKVRSMICQLGSDPIKYPPPCGQVATTHPAPCEPTVQLTKGLADALYNRKAIDFGDVIIIQISAASADMVNTKIVDSFGSTRSTNDEIKYRRWLLNAVDDDNDVLTVRLDSTINSKGVLLTPGAVIKVTSAFPIYWDYGSEYDMRCAIVIRDFSILCYRGVPINTNQPPERREVANSAAPTAQPTTDVVNHREGQQKCVCTGRECSKHGVQFAVCVRKCVPIKGISLEKVARECVFVDKEFRDMTNRNKRFLLYYYYATSVYQFHGKGNRVDLPKCILSEVRSVYPDEEEQTELGDNDK